jgi:hypothetical protein
MILPIYRNDLLKGMTELMPGQVFTKIGTLPAALKNKLVEGNMVIVNGNYICYYTNFVNIDRSVWQLLPMGLFTDSLLNNIQFHNTDQADIYTFTKTVQLEVPFTKASSAFSNEYVKKLFDSLGLSTSHIQKVEVRAYSSVEGSEKINTNLMNKRAEAFIQALKLYEPTVHRINIVTAENWLEFYRDIETTKFKEFRDFSKGAIKQRLTDTANSKALEPLLAKERKVVVTMYLSIRSTGSLLTDSSIFSDFKTAILKHDLTEARNIQKELVERIMDNKLPVQYINRLEVPQTKEYSPLLNDREVYKYLLRATTEYEALENFKALRQLDPSNGRINYNVCALRFYTWQYGNDTLGAKLLLKEINTLSTQGINPTLVKRMLINYYILKSEDQERVFNYAGKDSSLSNIRSIYEKLTLNDEDLYSLAKYYSFYEHEDWALELISPRIDKIDISENLVFYYVNLLFFNPESYGTDEFHKASLNAINLDRKRFCNFFLPSDKGGASMQLLDNEEIFKLFCEECK